VEVDERPTRGRFVLTGSQNLDVSAAVSQSLAGRTGVLRLLPLSLPELRRFEGAPRDLLSTRWAGGYPAIHDREIPADRWLADIQTYVQRDVRRLQPVSDLDAFIRFTRLCAGSTACELHLSRLGADAGVSHVTAGRWLSILEAGFLCFRLPPWHRNIRKQLVKAPKLHFYDTGLVCSLLGIRPPRELENHPLRGAIFETWVVSEAYKASLHRGEEPRLWHLRAARGPEVDLIVDRGVRATLVECKSGATMDMSWLEVLQRASALVSGAGTCAQIDSAVVYGGDGAWSAGDTAVPWSEAYARLGP
jgi:predicted AAA+ superfamily ATPase